METGRRFSRSILSAVDSAASPTRYHFSALDGLWGPSNAPALPTILRHSNVRSVRVMGVHNGLISGDPRTGRERWVLDEL